ncbi:MAG: hypothetical protein FWE72_09445, partial [Spirochaetaceae bacterium]|nr:hypothetical protein [Spirochaetaceae bacterium]
MALVGWGTIDEVNVLKVLGYVPSYAPEWYGTTYWIYKESFGPAENDKGFRYLLQTANPDETCVINLPITSLTKTDANIRCVDEDGDGYYFWGLGPKPAHCPECPDEPDGDDSNPSLGPLNEVGQRTIIDTYNSNFETGWDDWVQIGTDDGDWWRHSGEVDNNGFKILGAQSGDYYIYVNSNCSSCYPKKKFIIESPPINLKNKHCETQMDFYYHMNMGLWDSSGYKLELQISYNNGQTWVPNYWYKEHNQGTGWKYATTRFPASVNKIRFVGRTGLSHRTDIALDNITIGPAVKDPDLVINTNIIWNSNNSIYGDVLITNNSTLTINNCTISLFDNCKITIHPGAKLVIDGGLLTNACPDKLWYGILVAGNGHLHQWPQNQGTLELKNSAIIEN